MNMIIAEAAVRLLKFRAYSQYELKQKLLKQNYDELAVNQAIEYVTERGYLNDAALCNMLLAKYAEINKYSSKESFIRLRRRGLPAALIKAKLADWDEEFEYHAALKLALKHFSGDESQDMGKVVRRLYAKGFRSATVSKVLERLRDMAP
ncbi:regulatory protein RecX [Sporomusa malonica]|uniref:Regulatory protein RecX n=1 Tax=Sporomusa malonica TaxID=112901 RepID=A0A1W2AV31_9FIRM|nr:RecX family transcriptional regulator [Sporomusa malonica]SMC64597.1 RecX family protein [Sporomusa malonica]